MVSLHLGKNTPGFKDVQNKNIFCSERGLCLEQFPVPTLTCFRRDSGSPTRGCRERSKGEATPRRVPAAASEPGRAWHTLQKGGWAQAKACPGNRPEETSSSWGLLGIHRPAEKPLKALEEGRAGEGRVPAREARFPSITVGLPLRRGSDSLLLGQQRVS